MVQGLLPKSLLLCQNPLIERLSAFLYSFKTQKSLAINEHLLGCCDVLFCFLPRPWGISLFLDKPGIFLVDVAGTLGLLSSLSEQAVFITSPTAIPSPTTHLGNLIFSSSNTQALSDVTDSRAHGEGVCMFSFSLMQSSVSISQGKVVLSWCRWMRW